MGDNNEFSALSLSGFANLKANQIQSPYLNSLTLPDQFSSEFIVPEGQARTRGRFEMAFSQIGGSVLVGSGIGGAMGTFKGLSLSLDPWILELKQNFFPFGLGFKEVQKSDVLGSVKRTQLLNYITRNSSSMANTFGVIALTYSTIGWGLSFAQDRYDDLNTMVSAVATGALYGAISRPKSEANIAGKIFGFCFQIF